MRSLSNVKDIKCDDMGVWINNSCHKFYYTVTNEEDITIHPTKEKNGENVVTLKRGYFALKYDTNNDVRKRIDIIQLPDKEIYRYGLVQYSFKDGEEHPVQHYKHGNSKRNDREYVRTWKSTKVLLETASQNKRPCEALRHVISEDLGGIISCVGIGQLPRNCQQSSDLKCKKAVKEMPISQRKNMFGRGKVDDPWYLLLGASKKQNDNKETSFISDVRVGGEPLCVLASKRQLNDLRRFCCTKTEFKPLTVDPTFNIGQFNVIIAGANYEVNSADVLASLGWLTLEERRILCDVIDGNDEQLQYYDVDEDGPVVASDDDNIVNDGDIINT
ncbi:uncharacterized protein LOC114526793 [Dendronephthya gigantea]|uniref:uncharacterized protein LOC114526793 n=1 Tax=Dendronephthya gigantea TaxID=151771 RepID=UPI00106C38F0|nr:uncharacterized protein LOC114526793 [Dendronephthya gigantea]